jgi:large subunit ribosomal protein L27
MGRDHTLFARIDGKVTFRPSQRGRTFVDVLPVKDAAE